jgi:hypothetical protein
MSRWHLYSFYADLMFAPQSKIEETLREQQERDVELQQKMNEFQIGSFPKRESIVMKLLPTFQCLTIKRPQLNLYLVEKIGDESRSLILLRRGRIFYPKNEKDAFKMMSDREDIDCFDKVSSIKISYKN